VSFYTPPRCKPLRFQKNKVYRQIVNITSTVTGRRFRQIMAKYVSRTYQALLIGLVTGFISQSRSAITFIVGSLLSGGLIRTRQALIVVFWANVGCGGLVILAFLELKILVLYVLGLAGISVAFEKPARYRHLSTSLFGLGLLFYGLHLLRMGAAPVSNMDLPISSLLCSGESYFAAFLAGALLTALTQSSSGVSILAITMASSGLISYGQTMMFIYGTGLGSSAIVLFLSFKLRGKIKQVIIGQVFFNVIGVIVFVFLFYLEVYGHLPLVYSFLVSVTTKIPMTQQMALIYIIFNLGTAVILTILNGPYAYLLKRHWPEAQEEKWSQPRYLYDQALKDPETAQILVEKEQSRLLNRMINYTENLRQPHSKEAAFVLKELYASVLAISKEIRVFINALLSEEYSGRTIERVIYLQDRQSLLETLNDVFSNFSSELSQWNATAAAEQFKEVYVEALDFLLLTLCETDQVSNRENVRTLVQLTRDRSDLMKKIRKTFLAKQEGLDARDRTRFLLLTGFFERIVWTLNRMGLLFERNLAAGQRTGVSIP